MQQPKSKLSVAEESARFRRFLLSGEPCFVLPLPEGGREQVRYIYNVVFTGLRRYRFYLIFFIARIAQYIDFSPLKVLLYRLIGMRIGKDVFISPDVILDPHFPELIEIGQGTIIGWGAKLFAHSSTKQRYRVGRIKIGKEVMIGGYTVIRGGVEIGDGAETAYHSFVMESVPAGQKVTLHDAFTNVSKLAEIS